MDSTTRSSLKAGFSHAVICCAAAGVIAFMVPPRKDAVVVVVKSVQSSLSSGRCRTWWACRRAQQRPALCAPRSPQQTPFSQRRRSRCSQGKIFPCDYNMLAHIFCHEGCFWRKVGACILSVCVWWELPHGTAAMCVDTSRSSALYWAGVAWHCLAVTSLQPLQPRPPSQLTVRPPSPSHNPENFYTFTSCV